MPVILALKQTAQKEDLVPHNFCVGVTALTVVPPLSEGVVQMSKAAYLGTKFIEHCGVETMSGYQMSATEVQRVSVTVFTRLLLL